MENNTQHIFKEKTSLASMVHENTGISVAKCYQCGKCSASCPMVKDMDYAPSRLMRMLQTESPEMDDKVLRSQTVWFCVTCEMCLSRCPQEIDLPLIMPYLKRESLRQKKDNPKSKHIIEFHEAFCDMINKTGRLYELGFIADYNLRSGKLFHDVKLAPQLFLKGKLHLLPDMVKNRKHIRSIFKKTKGTIEKQ